MSSSPASFLDSIFFFLFQVLQHCVRIRSLLFASGSPASCPDFIIFFDIIPYFPHLSQPHDRASLIFFGIASVSLLSFPVTCPDHSSSQASCSGFLLVLQSWRLSSITPQYWVRGQNCSSFGFFTRVHFTLASLALRTHDSLVHLLY